MNSTAGILERFALGSLIVGLPDHADAVALLRPDDFRFPGHPALFKVIAGNTTATGAPPDVSTVVARCRESNLGRVWGKDPSAYISGLIDDGANTSSAVVQARELRLQSTRLSLHGILSSCSKQVDNINPDDLIEGLHTAMTDILKNSQSGGGIHLLDDILKIVNFDQKKNVIPSGIIDLDDCASLLSPGNLTVVAARPSMGKSTLMREMVLASSRQVPVLLVSLEENPSIVVKKLACGIAKVNISKIFKPWLLTEDELSSIMRALSTIHDECRMAFTPTFDISIPKLRMAIRRATLLGHAPKVVYIDYLQLMSRTQGLSSLDAIAEITRGLKLLAEEEQVAVVLLSQLNRDVERRDSAKPKLADLRDSGSIEQDADNVVFVWAHDIKEPNRTLTLAKQRSGSLGDFPVFFNLQIGRMWSSAKEVQ